MEKYITWYRLLLKVQLKRKSSWIQIGAFALVYIIVLNIHIPGNDNTQIGVYLEESEYGERILTELAKRKGVFHFQRYNRAEAVYEDVAAGKIESGVIFSNHFDKQIESHKLRETITYVTTPFATKGWVVQESIYSALFRIYSEEILKQGEMEIYQDSNEARRLDLLERNQFYLNGEEVFQVEIKEIELSTGLSAIKDEKKVELLPVHGLIGVFVFLTMFLAYGRKFEQGGMAFEKALTVGERQIFSYLHGIAAGTLPALTGFLFLLLDRSSKRKVIELILLLFLLLAGELWIMVIGRLLKNETSFVSTISAIVTAQIIICPIFINLASYIPALNFVRLLFPLGMYLHLVTL